MLENRYIIFFNFCWFQNSLPAALQLRLVITAYCFRVRALSGHAALALSLSSTDPKLNIIQVSAVCYFKVVGLLNYWQDAAYSLVIALQEVATSCINITIKAAMQQGAS